MTNNTITIDLQDRIGEIDDRLAEIRENVQDIDAKLDAADDEPADTEDDSDGNADVDELEAERDALEEEYETLSNAKDTIEAKIDAYGGSEFEFRELQWGHRTRINDRVRAAAIQDNLDTEAAKYGARKVVTVNVAIVGTPTNAPDDAKQYPGPIGEYLFECVENYHDLGDVQGMGNSDRSSRLQQDLDADA